MWSQSEHFLKHLHPYIKEWEIHYVLPKMYCLMWFLAFYVQSKTLCFNCRSLCQPCPSITQTVMKQWQGQWFFPLKWTWQEEHLLTTLLVSSMMGKTKKRKKVERTQELTELLAQEICLSALTETTVCLTWSRVKIRHIHWGADSHRHEIRVHVNKKDSTVFIGESRWNIKSKQLSWCLFSVACFFPFYILFHLYLIKQG